MSSRFHPLGTGRWVTWLAVLVLVVGGGVCAAADPAPDVQGPAMSLTPEKTTQPGAAAQPDKSAKSDQSAPSGKAVPAGPSVGPANEPAKKPDAAKTEAKEPAKTEAKESKTEAKEPAKTEAKEKPKNTIETGGEPLAPGMMKLLRDEIVGGIRRRGITDRWARFQSYAIGKVNSSAGRYTGSELAGNCRLRWYDHMMRDFLGAPAEAEQFTRELHAAASGSRDGLAQALAVAAAKMDAGQRPPRKPAAVTSPEQALEIIKQAIAEAQVAYCEALAPLNKQEIRLMQENLVPVLCTNNQVGHTLGDRGTGRQLCDLMEKMDREALHRAAEALAPIADAQLLEQLKGLKPSKHPVQVPGVTGTVLARIDTPSGAIIIGGRGPNTYQLDQMRDVAVVIDLGGGNTYYEGTVGPDRPVLVVINLEGHNTFRGTQAGIQGGAVLGVSLLANLGGDNTYDAQDVAQGSAVAGAGMLVDFGPNNRYRGLRRVQGQAIGGAGILISRGGHNDYHAAMWAQGFGHPLGFGLLENVVGNNHYYCGGMWRDSYPETPGCEGWGQGVGAGIRQVADGGVGVILDGGGENVYEFDYLAHGGGYWCGLGFARDFGGNTQRLICRTAYNGGPRTQPNFQRFGCGWGCHYAMGFLFDDSGDNVFEGTIMGTGMAWDCSLGVLCYFGNGHNEYKATGGLTQGTAHQMGMGILFDYNGDDVYEGYGQGFAPSGISYHDMPACGGNFAFLIDYGGKDKYGCGAEDNCYIQRGDVGGFLIDRPRPDEVEPTPTATAPPPRTAAGS